MTVYVTAPPDQQPLVEEIRKALLAAGHSLLVPDLVCSPVDGAARRMQCVASADAIVFIFAPSGAAEPWIELGAAFVRGCVVIVMALADWQCSFLSLPEIYLAPTVPDVVLVANKTQYHRHRITTRIEIKP